MYKCFKEMQIADQQLAIALVMEVKKHPSLYSTNLAIYTKKSDTIKDWEEVGKAMNMSAADCKEKWKNLRAVFLRHLKAQRTEGKKKMKPYYLSEHIQFIVPHLAPALLEGTEHSATEQILETETVFQTIDASDRSSEVQSEYDHDDPFLVHVEESIEEPSKSKRRKLSLHETISQPSVQPETGPSKDTVTSFLKSLAPELNDMNHNQFKTFKRRVLTLIDDITASSF